MKHFSREHRRCATALESSHKQSLILETASEEERSLPEDGQAATRAGKNLSQRCPDVPGRRTARFMTCCLVLWAVDRYDFPDSDFIRRVDSGQIGFRLLM